MTCLAIFRGLVKHGSLLRFRPVVLNQMGLGPVSVVGSAARCSADAQAIDEDVQETVDAVLPARLIVHVAHADVAPEELLRALVGMCHMNDQPGWQDGVHRLLDIFVDGLRIR